MIISNLKKIKKNRGFTLVELITVIGIMFMLTSAFLAGYHDSNNKTTTKTALQNLANDIRLTQNNSLGLVATSPTDVASSSWGIYMETGSSSYIIYMDNNLDKQYNASEKFLFRKLPANVKIKNQLTVGSITYNTSGRKLNIIFEPPDPTTWIKVDTNDAASTTNAILFLENNTGDVSKKLEVNFYGAINIY